jgi:hypothetical protein
MKRDLHISDTRIGLLQGLSFAIFYTLAGLPFGKTRRLGLDAKSSPSEWLLSILTAACSAARNFWCSYSHGRRCREARSPVRIFAHRRHLPPGQLGSP